MARKKGVATIEAAIPETDIVETMIQLADSEEETPEAGAGGEGPKPTDPEWNDHVKSQFLADEVDGEGNPTTDGLRRVTELLLGPIVSSIPTVIRAPQGPGDMNATVLVEVGIEQQGIMRVYGDAVNISPENCPEYCHHAVATAITRCEGRIYRKALRLRRILAAEEKGGPRPPVVPLGGPTPTPQGAIEIWLVHAIEKTCRDLGIDLFAFINDGKSRYDAIGVVPQATGEKMMEALQGYLQNPKKIPAHIKKGGAA